MGSGAAKTRRSTSAAGGDGRWARSIRAPRTFEAILQQLQDALAAGDLRAGDRLPSERELAERFGVSRTSVREALRVLETLGVAEVRRGSQGVRLRAAPGDAFGDLMRLHIALGHYPPEQAIELRATVESAAAAALARSGAPATLARLDELVEAMDAPALDGEAFHHLDVDFHDALVAGAGNELARLLHRSCRTLIHEAMLDALRADDWPATRAELTREHRAIRDAIRDRDDALASTRVRAHAARWGARAIAARGATGGD